jgi:hypothetical protein
MTVAKAQERPQQAVEVQNIFAQAAHFRVY